MKIYIVIPAYNEQDRIIKVLKDVEKSKLPIVVVDDESEDNTYQRLQKYKGKNPKLVLLRHKVNLGKGAAMKTGADAAFLLGADAVVFMDSDGQHKAKDIDKFIKALKKGKFDVVFGSRNLGHGVPFVRFIGNKFASVLISILFNIYISDPLCGFRGLTKAAYKKIYWESVGYGVETEMVIRTGINKLKHCEVNVATVYLDSVKGVTILDAFNILIDVFRWRVKI